MSGQLSSKLAWELANPIWASTLNPIISNPLSSATIIKNVALIDGTTVINHGLGRNMQGWWLVDVQGPATIYRNAPFNSLTLSLSSSAPAIVNIGVF